MWAKVKSGVSGQGSDNVVGTHRETHRKLVEGIKSLSRVRQRDQRFVRSSSEACQRYQKLVVSWSRACR
ncbi:hypothetical protein BHM03_00021096, partial [Ensete ventricosum]